MRGLAACPGSTVSARVLLVFIASRSNGASSQRHDRAAACNRPFVPRMAVSREQVDAVDTVHGHAAAVNRMHRHC